MRRALSSAFSARDLAEPLIPLEAGLAAPEARAACLERGSAVAGVTEGGRWKGWVSLEDLQGEGPCGQVLRPFAERPILSETASLREVVLALGGGGPLFVRLLGEVGAVVTLADLQKAPMRMWLFGVVTLSEMLMTRMLDRQLPGGAWCSYLSEARLEGARAFQEERRRRGEELPLEACLQFGDKADALLKDERCRTLIGFESRREGQKFFRRMEALRNNLAHAQALPTEDLTVLVLLAEGLDGLLEVAENPLPEGAV